MVDSRAAYHLLLHMRAIPCVCSKWVGNTMARLLLTKDGCLPTKVQQKKRIKVKLMDLGMMEKRWLIYNQLKKRDMPQAFYKMFRSRIFGFLCAGSAKISCLKARCQLTHRSRTTRPLLSTMCFPRVVSGKLTLLFQVLMRWNPKPFNLWRNLSQIPRSKPVPFQVPLLARHPPQVLQLGNGGNLKPPKCQLLWVGSMYQLLCYSYDMLDAS